MCFNDVGRRTKLRICLAQILGAYDNLNAQMYAHERHRSHAHPNTQGYFQAQDHSHARHQTYSQPRLQLPSGNPYLVLNERRRSLEDHSFDNHLQDLQQSDGHTYNHPTSETEHQQLLRLYAAIQAQAETLHYLREIQRTGQLHLSINITPHEQIVYYICLAPGCPCTRLFLSERDVHLHLQQTSHKHGCNSATGNHIEISHLQAKCTEYFATGAETMHTEDFANLLDDVLFFFLLRMPECKMRDALSGRILHAYDANMPNLCDVKAATGFLNHRSVDGHYQRHRTLISAQALRTPGQVLELQTLPQKSSHSPYHGDESAFNGFQSCIHTVSCID